jgi:hypothetical protein
MKARRVIGRLSEHPLSRFGYRCTAEHEATIVKQ